ncbi:2471_t:CDS:1, partial [Ambispora leptoticha]
KYDYAFKQSDVDEYLKKILIEHRCQLPWIPYNEFKNIVKVGKGGFAVVHYARWIDKSSNIEQSVALKTHHTYDTNQFIEEMKIYSKISEANPSFLKCFGISKDYKGKYVLVLEYAAIGSLSKNLYNISQMDWKKKLKVLHCIIFDLEAIHSQGYIHKDLHNGNILQNELDNAYIADLGLSSPLKNEDEGIVGVLPYIAPEILDKGQYTTASDIYSFGMIMWEILYGMSVSYNQKFAMPQLPIQICCNGLRPPINEKAPQCYVNLMKECWDKDPEKRPPAKKLCDIFNRWQDDENILLELSRSETRIENIEKLHSSMFSGGSKFISKSILDVNSELQF